MPCPPNGFESLSNCWESYTWGFPVKTSIELVVQFLVIDLGANGDNLGPWRTFAPLVQFRDLRPTPHYLQGKTLVGGVRGENDSLTAVN